VSGTTATLGVIAALLFTQAAAFGDDAAPPAALVPTGAAPAPVVVDPQAEAVARGLRNRANWTLAYVDRPQTLYEGMESFGFMGSQLFGGPSGYRRSIFAIKYARGLTDALEMGLGFARLYCGGAGLGACASSLAPDLSLRYAALAGPRRRLVLGTELTDFDFRARAWARLALIVPRRFSFEIEPRLTWGIRSITMPAWWNTSVTQNGNQSRLTLVFDANVQLGERVNAWLDAVPYVPVSDLAHDPSTTALEVGTGVSVSVTKGFELGASCWRYDVFAARRWEYVPDVYECSLGIVARRFGASPLEAKTMPPPLDSY
jgi:hypothetical protein